MSSITITADNTGYNIKSTTITTNEILELNNAAGVTCQDLNFKDGEIIFNPGGITTTLTPSSTSARVITLPDTDGTLVTGSIITTPGLYIPLTYDRDNATSDTEYAAMGRFIYPGSDAWPLAGVKTLTRMDFGMTSYNVRLFDITNNTTIASIAGLTNTIDVITNLTPLTSIPTGQATLELQIQCTGGDGTQYAYLTSAQFYNSSGIILNATDFAGFNQFFNFATANTTGTWQQVRLAANSWTLRKSTAAETVYVAMDMMLPFNTNTNKGVRISAIKVVYGVGTVDLTATPTDSLSIKDFTTGSPVISSFGGTLTGTYFSGIGNYIVTRTLGTPAYMNTANSTLNFELTFSTDTTSVLDFYGIYIVYTIAF